MSFLKLNNKLITVGEKLLSINNIPHVIYDGNTVVWYDFTDLSTITKDSNDFVSRWKDKLNSGRDLIQNTGISQPKWFNNDGVLFDGINDFMQTSSFLYNKPTMIYMVYKINELQSNKTYNVILDCNSSTRRLVFYYKEPTFYSIYSGNETYTNIPITTNQYFIARIKFYSLLINNLKINDVLSLDYNVGSHVGGDGILLGKIGAGQTIDCFPNIVVKELLYRVGIETSENEEIIYNYLKNKYNL
jgi:hypothetical protein